MKEIVHSTKHFPILSKTEKQMNGAEKEADLWRTIAVKLSILA